MGYILLSPEYIEFTGEKEDKNWHLFETEEVYYDEDGFLHNSDVPIEDERDYITIADGIDVKISKNSQCKNTENDKSKTCKVICSNTTDLKGEDFIPFNIKYNLQKIKGQYLNEFIEEYIKEHDKDNIEEYVFKKTYNKYYTDENRTFFYSDDADTIRILACMLRRCVCGNCMRSLYSNLDNED